MKEVVIMYCIYSGKEITPEEATVEHIIPLSLGGNDQFTIYVEKKSNSDVGSKIDGKFSQDLLIGLSQLPYDNRGHSKKPKEVRMRGIMDNAHPVTWTLSKRGGRIFDHITNEVVQRSAKLKLTSKIDLTIRFRFVCKVALATGFYLFGEDFVKYTDCDSLRKGMLCDDLENQRLDLRFHDYLHKPKEQDAVQQETAEMLLKYLETSAVIFSFAEGRCIVFVSINGKYIGMVNFAADIEKLPIQDDLFRLGIVLSCEKNKLSKKSFWQSIFDMSIDMGIIDSDTAERIKSENRSDFQEKDL